MSMVAPPSLFLARPPHHGRIGLLVQQRHLRSSTGAAIGNISSVGASLEVGFMTAVRDASPVGTTITSVPPALSLGVTSTVPKGASRSTRTIRGATAKGPARPPTLQQRPEGS
jgi:hypothetical protein